MSTSGEGDTASSSRAGVSRRPRGREGTLRRGASSSQRYVCCIKRRKQENQKERMKADGQMLWKPKQGAGFLLFCAYYACLPFYPRYSFCPCRANEPHHPLPLWLPTWSACTKCCCSCTVHAPHRIMKTDSGAWSCRRSDWRQHFGPRVRHGVLFWHPAKWHNVGPE